MTQQAPLQSAQAYTRAGIFVIPVPHRKKVPVLTGWPELRLSEADLSRYFNGQPINMGALLGIGGLADLDLDAPEAVTVASAYAPETGFAFGRKSHPYSHYFYRTDPALKSHKFRDPLLKDQDGDEKDTLLEIRAQKQDGGIGHQTVLPPSIHPSGEVYEFVPGATRLIQNVDHSALEEAARKIAAASLLARYFAREGSRHDAFLAMAGIFARAGWTEEDAFTFCFAIYRVMWGQAADRSACKSEVKTTFEKLKTDAPTSGIPRLKELVNPIVVNQALEWLGISGQIKQDVPQSNTTATFKEAPGETLLAKPAPMRAAAFHGLAGEFVRIVGPESEADPAALLIQFLIVAGIYLDRHGYFEVEATRHYSNLFGIICGDTSQGRKGTALDRVKEPYARADADFADRCFTSGLASGEGLIWGVRNPVKEIRFKKGGTEGVNVVTDEGVADKRLCVIEGEFSRVLKVSAGPTNILSAVLRNAWDSGNLSNLTKNNRLKATGAHIGIIGHITREEVTRLLTNTESANGFANRFLWVWSERSKALPDGGHLPADALDGIREGLIAAEGNIYHDQPAMCRDADARALWHEVYPDLSQGRPGLVGAITGRAAPQVMRLALIFALLDCTKDIRLPHLQAALEIWRYCSASASYIFGESIGDETADEIRRFLITVGSAGATRTDISTFFGKNKPSAEISRALSVLAQHGQARFETEPPKEGTDGRGRRGERWFACDK